MRSFFPVLVSEAYVPVQFFDYRLTVFRELQSLLDHEGGNLPVCDLAVRRLRAGGLRAAESQHSVGGEVLPARNVLLSE